MLLASLLLTSERLNFVKVNSLRRFISSERFSTLFLFVDPYCIVAYRRHLWAGVAGRVGAV